MDAPVGWISETDLRAETNVSDENHRIFHRNLVNWREHGLLPRLYDGHQVPFSLPLGFAIGNEAWHPPITIEMVKRINELRLRNGRRSGDMDKWLWQVWLEGYPIDIIEWCRDRLISLQPLEKMDPKDVAATATRKPGKRSDPRRSFYRRLMARGWFGLMTWAAGVAIGARPPESLFDPRSPPRFALARIFGVGTGDSVIHDGVAGSRIENMSIARLLAVLNEEIGADELLKVREDCWVLSHSHKVPTFLGRMLAAMWGWVSCRALLLPGLIILHRSPDHQTTLLDVIKRHSDSPTVQQFELPHAR